MARRRHIGIVIILIVSVFLGLSFLLTGRGHSEEDRKPSFPPDKAVFTVGNGVLHGAATAPKLENATLKAELGNAAWKVLHTMMAKFPDKPTEDDSAALKSYVHLFARLYPCGDCARHFQEILKKYPPQVASRSTAAAWACHVHNEVNKSLKKDIFDCSKIGDFYDCGCADDEAPTKGSGQAGPEGFTPLELDKEGLTRGG